MNTFNDTITLFTVKKSLFGPKLKFKKIKGQ